MHGEGTKRRWKNPRGNSVCPIPRKGLDGISVTKYYTFKERLNWMGT